MTPLIKGLVIAAVQVGLVASVGAKLLYDRATRPRVWTLAAPYDPNLPIRGRYVSLQLVVEPRGVRETKPGSVSQSLQPINLQVEGDRLVAEANPLQPDYDSSNLHLRFIDRWRSSLLSTFPIPRVAKRVKNSGSKSQFRRKALPVQSAWA